MAQMNHVSTWGGRFIVPIPSVAIVDLEDLAR
jgi:hypothetical protein